MSPEGSRLIDALSRYQRQMRIGAIAYAALSGAAATGAMIVLLSIAEVPDPRVRAISAMTFMVVSGSIAAWRWRRISYRSVAGTLASRGHDPENTIVAAEAVVSGRVAAPHDIVARALLDAADARLRQLPDAAVGATRAVLLATAGVLAAASLGVWLPGFNLTTIAAREGTTTGDPRPLPPGDIRVVVMPPPYAAMEVVEVVNPSSIATLAGSRVRFEASPAAAGLVLMTNSASTAFAASGDTISTELVATESQPLVIRHHQGRSSDRLITLQVHSDAPPAVRIEQPAKDLMFPDVDREVPVTIDARDDIALQTLTLRYTRVSGAGETFTFTEGEWPVNVVRHAAGHWTARALLTLGSLKLEDGDTLVYRAVARDTNPKGDPAASDTFLIEIGRTAGIAASGFALPEDQERQALSQQMLIMKTERLHAERGKLTAEALLEQSRLLAIEQRMVKAEFVFMTGGEVADEVEEAAHAHELAEGRLENTAQVELLNAIREMSRAEARLNDGNTGEALPLERAALRALQRAFDRRRYLLRTMPERTRIDQSRRLTGDTPASNSPRMREATVASDPRVRDARDLLGDLRSSEVQGANLALLASRVLALDPRSLRLQEAALRLSSAREADERRRATQDAAAGVIEFLRTRLVYSSPPPLTRDSLQGFLAEESREASRRR